MSDIERALITRLVDTGELKMVNAAKVTAADFTDDDARDAFVQIQRHYARHGSVPSMLVLQDITSFEPIETNDRVSSLVERVKERSLYRDLSERLEAVRAATLDGDSAEGLAVFKAAAAELSQLHVNLGPPFVPKDAIMASIARYHETKEAKGILGIPWMWPHVNDATGGIRPAEYVALHGRPKTYKSWVSEAQTVHAHRFKGTSFLYCYKEMSEEEYQDRMVALYAGVNWGRFKRGKLTEEQEQKLVLAKEEILDGAPYWFKRVNGIGMEGFSEFWSMVEEYEPEMVVFDGFYLLDPDSEWKVLTALSRTLRQRLDAAKIPGMVTLQTNREGNVGYSDSFEQDCSLLLRITREESHVQAMEDRIMCGASRHTMFDPFIIHTRPAVNFGQKRVERTEGEGDDGEGLKDPDEPDNTDIVGDEENASGDLGD